MYPVAILAGGLATRMRPLTEVVPKVLLDVAGRPFVEHQLALLRANGLTDVVFCVGHMGEQVEALVGDGRAYGLRVRYSWDGPRLLGTGGALLRALPLLGDPFFVMYGDSYLRCDFQDVARTFAASGKRGLMTVFRNNDRFDRSNVRFEGGQILWYDKSIRSPEMCHIDYGLGILRTMALSSYPADTPLDLARVYQDLLAAGQLAAYEVGERFHEIGSPEGLAETDRLLRGGEDGPGTA